jgi:hypothetical protein
MSTARGYLRAAAARNNDPQGVAAAEWHAGVRAAKRVAAASSTATLHRCWDAARREAYRLPVGAAGAFTPDDHYAWGYVGALAGILDERDCGMSAL